MSLFKRLFSPNQMSDLERMAEDSRKRRRQESELARDTAKARKALMSSFVRQNGGMIRKELKGARSVLHRAHFHGLRLEETDSFQYGHYYWSVKESYWDTKDPYKGGRSHEYWRSIIEVRFNLDQDDTIVGGQVSLFGNDPIPAQDFSENWLRERVHASVAANLS